MTTYLMSLYDIDNFHNDNQNLTNLSSTLILSINRLLYHSITSIIFSVKIVCAEYLSE